VDVEDRISRLEELLLKVVERLEYIESMLKTLGLDNETLSIASRLVIAFSKPATSALDAARRVVSITNSLPYIDPITRSIVEALSDCSSLSVSEITRRVRELRGTASRRIVRERLYRLVRIGVVVPTNGKRPKYMLKTCIDRG